MYVVSGGWWLVCRLNRVNVTRDREQSPASGDEFCFQKGVHGMRFKQNSTKQ